MRTTTYDPRFYEAIRSGCQASAAALVPVILAEVGPVATVVDVGCGEGWWGSAFADAGADVVGIDGDYVQDPAIDVLPMDLAQPFGLERTFDLAVCLEVAEHLPKSRAGSFVADLSALSRTVVFSAAMPRQGGNGHVNCQPPAYWAGLFRSHGYGWLDPRPTIWQDDCIEPWYRGNLLVFTQGAGELVADPNHVIPPDLWLERR